MKHSEAVEGGFLKTMSEDDLKRFTPSELLLYKIATEHRYVLAHTSIYQHIPEHTSTYQYMHVYTSTYWLVLVYTDPTWVQMDGRRAEKSH